MKTIVAVIVFNRLENIHRWTRCWQQCDRMDAELVIIHNVESPADSIPFKKVCDAADVKYIARQNIGFDIGALQDVCRERLAGFSNDWEKLLWITDDVIPLKNDFVGLFTESLKESGVGVVCTELSDEYRRHIRTSGFCIRKSTSLKLKFSNDRITTKQHCWEFEHRGNNTFLDQIQKMGLRAKLVDDNLSSSPLWDSHYRTSLNRMKEFNQTFPMTDKVVFICPIYNTFPEIISSLKNQTHQNWELILVHDGKNEAGLKDIVKAIGDKRITYIETPERRGNWGHYYRKFYLNEIKEGRIAKDADYIVITNADNHHVPVYCEYLLFAFGVRPDCVAAYCSQMVHSYLSSQQTAEFKIGQTSSNLKWVDYKWGVINCKLQLGYVDCGGVMVRKEAACSVGWRDIETHSSDWIYFSDILNKYGADKWVKVNGCLLTHN